MSIYFYYNNLIIFIRINYSLCSYSYHLPIFLTAKEQQLKLREKKIAASQKTSSRHAHKNVVEKENRTPAANKDKGKPSTNTKSCFSPIVGIPDRYNPKPRASPLEVKKQNPQLEKFPKVGSKFSPLGVRKLGQSPKLGRSPLSVQKKGTVAETSTLISPITKGQTYNAASAESFATVEMTKRI